MVRGAENKRGIIEETVFPLSEGVGEGKREKYKLRKNCRYFTLSSHTFPGKESYLLPHNLPVPALLYSALSSYRGRWLKEEEKLRHIQNQQCGGIVNSPTQLFIHSSIHPSSHPSSQPASHSPLCAQPCAVKNTFLCGSHDTWPLGICLRVRIRWGPPSSNPDNPLHPPHSVSPQTGQRLCPAQHEPLHPAPGPGLPGGMSGQWKGRTI